MFTMDERSLVLMFVLTYLRRGVSFDGLQNLNKYTHILSKLDFLSTFHFESLFFYSLCSFVVVNVLV